MRLFFALWPDDTVRQRLAEAAGAVGLPDGRRVPDRNLHLTLVFLGQVDEIVEHRLRQGAAGIRAAPFALEFDRAGSFRSSGVAWLAPRECPPALEDLVGKLKSLALRCDIETEERPYRPHLTIARRLRRPPRPVEFAPIHWQIKSFCLVRSTPGEAGSEYEVRHAWTPN